MPYPWSYNYGQLSDLGSAFMSDNPAVAYSAFLQPARGQTSGAFYRWAQQQYQPAYAQYALRSATGQAPQDQDFWSYLTGGGASGILGQYQSLSPYERGEQPSRFVGRLNWRL